MTTNSGQVRNPFYIFRVKREERGNAVAALLFILLWNVLVICKYGSQFFALSDNYRKLFLKFHVSGFDPISYIVISHWGASYNIYRHPLLAFFMFIPNQIDQGLMALTGTNQAVVIMAVILTFCAFYSFLFLTRIFREVVGLRGFDAWLLGWLTFSFGYVIVSISVPDHFCLSMFMLILTLYVAGKKLKARHPFTIWQTVLFFIVTAGISLNNGIKVFLANLFVNGKRFWRPANLLLAVIVPSLLIWGFARLEWEHFEKPNYVARQKAKAKKHDKLIANTYLQVADTMHTADTALIRRTSLAIVARKDSLKAAKDSRRAVHAHAGKPIAHGEFSQWTDITTPRAWSLIENVLGEPIQLHSDHLLEDVLVNRPVIVHYRFAFNYIVEALVFLLFLAGVWAGRRSRFLWMALSFLGFDILIHVVLGFGLNEVYIMSAHWLFVVTIAVAYLSHGLQQRDCRSHSLVALRILLLLLTIYLLVYNGVLYAHFLLA